MGRTSARVRIGFLDRLCGGQSVGEVSALTCILCVTCVHVDVHKRCSLSLPNRLTLNLGSSTQSHWTRQRCACVRSRVLSSSTFFTQLLRSSGETHENVQSQLATASSCKRASLSCISSTATALTLWRGDRTRRRARGRPRAVLFHFQLSTRNNRTSRWTLTGILDAQPTRVATHQTNS